MEMLGKEGTEQFKVTTTQDGQLIREQKIHDPFINCTVAMKISRWDLFKAMFRRQYETRLVVRVSGTQGAERAIMMLDPDALERDTTDILEQGRISRETGMTQGYINPIEVVNAD